MKLVIEELLHPGVKFLVAWYTPFDKIVQVTQIGTTDIRPSSFPLSSAV